MSGATLISCCYCGAQDIFKIHKGKRRQLACLSCGAPMRKMTQVKVTEPVAKPAPEAKPAASPGRDKYKSKYEKYKSKYETSKRHAAYYKKRKKKKGWVAELWDDLDDIFDIDDWFD